MRQQIFEKLSLLLPDNIVRAITARKLRDFFTEFINSFLLIFLGDWQSTVYYQPGDVVIKDGTSYRCRVAHTNQMPPNTAYWDVVAKSMVGPKGDKGDVGPAGTTNPTNNFLPVRTGTGVFSDSILQQVDAMADQRRGIELASTSRKYFGGFGSTMSYSDPNSVNDWNDQSNVRSGNGNTLLSGSANNGHGGGGYYQTFNFETVSNDGTGNITQLAVPLNVPVSSIYYRTRMSAVWSSWYRLSNGYEVTLQPNGTNVVFNIRRPYKFVWSTVYNNGVTSSTPPPSTVEANTDANLTLTGTAGKTLTIFIQPIS